MDPLLAALNKTEENALVGSLIIVRTVKATGGDIDDAIEAMHTMINSARARHDGDKGTPDGPS